MVLAGATALAVATGIWYVSLNAFLNYFNNWVLSPEPKGLGFSMPIFYSTWHMVASSIGCAIILRLRGLPPPSLEELKSCWKGVLPLALCTSVNIACNNASLALVSLFVNQVIKGTTPLITVRRRSTFWGLHRVSLARRENSSCAAAATTQPRSSQSSWVVGIRPRERSKLLQE